MKLRTLSAIALVTAAISSPVFAQDIDNASVQKPAHALRHYRGAYNEVQGPGFVAPRAAAGGSYFEGESFDRSRVGGHDADFNPSGS